jgi:hypothetical protein
MPRIFLGPACFLGPHPFVTMARSMRTNRITQGLLVPQLRLEF